MIRTSWLAMTFLLFGVGYYIGQMSVAKTAQSAALQASEAHRLLEQGALEIAAIEDESIRRMRSEELLEKTLKLFMIDISLRIQPSPLNAESKATHSISSEAPHPAKTRKKKRSALELLSPTQVKSFEETLLTSRNPKELEEALSELADRSFDFNFTRSHYPEPDQMKEILGHYIGQIVFDDGRANWRLHMKLSIAENSPDDNPYYESSWSITNGKGEVSNTSESGTLKGVTVANSQPRSFFIQIDDYTYHLYKSQTSETCAGLVYHGAEKKESIGRFFLTKR